MAEEARVGRHGLPRTPGTRQDPVAEAGASRKPVGPWELFAGT
jgi:hypothetical protein